MGKFQLDSTDIFILNLLQYDGQKVQKELAGLLNISESSINQRIKKLKNANYIKSTVAILNHEKIKPCIAFIEITLKSNTAHNLQDFKETIKNYVEVRFCYHLTGSVDFLLKVLTKDLYTHHEFIQKKIRKIPYIEKMNAMLMLSEDKNETALPLNLLMGLFMLINSSIFMD
eukprot:gene14703-17380_t